MGSVESGRVLRSKLFCCFLIGQLACHLLPTRLDHQIPVPLLSKISYKSEEMAGGCHSGDIYRYGALALTHPSQPGLVLATKTSRSRLVVSTSYLRSFTTSTTDIAMFAVSSSLQHSYCESSNILTQYQWRLTIYGDKRSTTKLLQMNQNNRLIPHCSG